MVLVEEATRDAEGPPIETSRSHVVDDVQLQGTIGAHLPSKEPPRTVPSSFSAEATTRDSMLDAMVALWECEGRNRGVKQMYDSTFQAQLWAQQSSLFNGFIKHLKLSC